MNLLPTLPNVILIPPISGAHASERLRRGRLMIDEFKLWQRHEPLEYRTTPEKFLFLA